MELWVLYYNVKIAANFCEEETGGDILHADIAVELIDSKSENVSVCKLKHTCA